MTQNPYDDPLPPSRVPPILIGAITSFGGVILLSVVTSVNGAAAMFGLCCCMPIAFVPLGIVPAFVARRREPTITPGGGFTVAFVAVGLGLIVWAGLTATQIDPTEVAEAARETAIRANREQGSPLGPEEIDAMADSVAAMTPYLPALYALVTTVLAGFAGMVTVLMMRPRRGIGDHEPPA